MPTPLLSPTDVTASAPANATAVTVTWIDPNPAGLPASAGKYSFIASIVNRDGLTPLSTPISATVAAGTLTVDLPFGTGAGAPTSADFPSKYVVQVVAHATDAAFADSPPGVQVYWDSNVALVIQVGSQTFTLTRSSSLSGVYRLPVSPDNALNIALSDLQSFASTVGVTLPTKWPDGSDINAGLSVSKLAVDTTRKLFAMNISFAINFSVPLVPGLTINSVALSVARTDGVHTL